MTGLERLLWALRTSAGDSLLDACNPCPWTLLLPISPTVQPSAGPVPVPVGPLTEDTALDQDRRLAFWPVPSDREFIAGADSERSNEVKVARVDHASVALPPAATAGLTFRWEVVERQSPRGHEDQCR